MNRLSNDSCYGLHCLLIYDDLETFREFYSYFAQKLLEKKDNIVLIAPFYETISSVRQTLSSGPRAIDVKEYEENLQRLLIYDSLNEYFGEEPVMDARKKIMKRSLQNNKEAGLSVLDDMGSFYFKMQEEKLVDFEKSLPVHFDDMAYNGICAYHQNDFNRLSEEQKEEIMKHHSETFRLEAY
ncbi:MAG: MEDS domain-containing protein [Candidatus Nitrosocosmicus sp.]|nr:MEDS domain-containing protein [Candidatus Nitrosocosmicus sp.]